MDDLMNSGGISKNVTDFGLQYFNLVIPCPFLEDNSCSIYAERPLRCREYLVTSPAINCNSPTKDTVELVDFPVLASQILSKLNQPWTKYANHWVPISIVTHLVKQHPEKITLRHSKEWMDDVLKALS
jgi:hypothetical protein